MIFSSSLGTRWSYTNKRYVSLLAVALTCMTLCPHKPSIFQFFPKKTKLWTGKMQNMQYL
uniref:Uncharacterized protein n=1 Tax=Rhizophora mucronata TaxID=61149 RepID=A0A2P2M6B9_RHIMU